MRALTTAELIEVWERGIEQQPVERAIEILNMACAGNSFEEITAFAISVRDRLLLTLREWMFGPNMNAVFRCPACDETLEVTFTGSDLFREAAAPQEVQLSAGGYDVRLRPVVSGDLLAAAGTQDGRGEEVLIRRCISSVAQAGAAVALEQLPPEVINAAAARLSECDPQADIQIAMACPSCGRQQHAPFDVVSFFWTEIEGRAVRILRDVHTLASAYGWHEGEILALSPTKRQIYLEMAGA